MVQHRVHEPDRAFAHGRALFVYQDEDGGEEWGGERGAVVVEVGAVGVGAEFGAVGTEMTGISTGLFRREFIAAHLTSGKPRPARLYTPPPAPMLDALALAT